MENNETRTRLYGITALAGEYCNALQSLTAMERDEFVLTMTDLLPRIYWEFADLAEQKIQNCTQPDHEEFDPEYPISIEEDGEEFFSEYVDEDFYESIRRNVEMLLGPDDTFLETFEEDMKYSDTPIAASISESLADIFQPLYNFISAVRESEGEALIPAYRNCRENFEYYWSQTLCNVLRPLNRLRFRND